MSEKVGAERIDFFGAQAEARVSALVAELERDSAVEVMVSVHPRSANYREAEWLAGTAFACVWLAVFLYHPADFDFTFLPVELFGAFIAGAIVTRTANAIKRILAGRRAMAREVNRAAKAVFHDLGVSRTRGRTGVLVYVSMLEGRTEIVSDVGVPKVAALSSVVPKLDQAVRQRDLEAFSSLLAELGPTLAKLLPRVRSDENELADELQEGA